MSYINRATFIMCAIYGQSYCTAAFEAFGLITSNSLRALVLYGISLYLMFVSKLCIVFLSSAASYFLFQGYLPEFGEFGYLHYKFTPIIVRFLSTMHHS